MLQKIRLYLFLFFLKTDPLTCIQLKCRKKKITKEELLCSLLNIIKTIFFTQSVLIDQQNSQAILNDHIYLYKNTKYLELIEKEKYKRLISIKLNYMKPKLN